MVPPSGVKTKFNSAAQTTILLIQWYQSQQSSNAFLSLRQNWTFGIARSIDILGVLFPHQATLALVVWNLASKVDSTPHHQIIIIIIAMTMFMVLSSWPKSLREFTRFIWWMQSSCRLSPGGRQPSDQASRLRPNSPVSEKVMQRIGSIPIETKKTSK